MLKSLLLSCLLSCSVSTTTPLSSPVLEPSMSISRDVSQSSTSALYQYLPYSSNAVNSNDDLIAGNVYTFSTTDSFGNTFIDDISGYVSFELLYIVNVLGDISVDDYGFSGYLPCLSTIDVDPDSYCFYLYCQVGSLNFSFYSEDLLIECDIVLPSGFIDDSSYSSLYEYFSICERSYYHYVIIPSSSNSNLYRLLYDFYYGLFKNDDLSSIDSGVNIPFDNWLAHTCTIATLILLVVVAFFFLRWLFKVISGLILLRH